MVVSASLKKLRPTQFLSKSISQLDPWLLAVLICFTIFAWASWGKLEYPIIDVGRETEISARMADGQWLYRDVKTYYGPLAYAVNALALTLFGHHLEVFYSVGLLLALFATLLFYHLAKRLMDAPWATLCSICFLIYCAIGPGLFNFIVPYSYGAVYAVVLCLLAVLWLDCYVRHGQLGWLIAAAVACGFAGIAKQEYGVAILGGVLIGSNVYPAQSLKRRIGRLIVVLSFAALAALLPLVLLAQHVSWQVLISSLAPISEVDNLKHSSFFYVSPLKTLHVWLVTLGRFLVVGLFVGVAVALAQAFSSAKFTSPVHLFKRWIEIPLAIALIGASLMILGLFLQFFNFDLLNKIPGLFFKPLSDLSWCLPILTGWFIFTRPRYSQTDQAPLLWALLVFMLLLNARWLFYINFYGLYAGPAVLLFFVLLYRSTRQSRSFIWRCLFVCLLLASTVKFTDLLLYRYPVSSSYGTFYGKEQALAQSFNQAIATITDSKASAVLVLPEGNLLNFLTATHSPSRELTFLPPVLPMAQDEQNFIAYMAAHPPELIVYVPRDFEEWGYQTYAEVDPLVDRWITQHTLLHTFPISDSMGEGAIQIYAGNQ